MSLEDIVEFRKNGDARAKIRRSLEGEPQLEHRARA
jgi:hypothetical protein